MTIHTLQQQRVIKFYGKSVLQKNDEILFKNEKMKMQKVEKWHLMYRYFNQYDANGRV
jgi:hypothetical protein